MRRLRLTKKHTFALSFGTYVLLLMLALGILFFAISQYVVTTQINRQLATAVYEIIKDHLYKEKESISFKKDDAGTTLREFLVQGNMSAVIWDKDGNVLRTYGIFSINEGGGDDTVQVTKLRESARTGNQPVYSVFSWNGQPVQMLFVPLKSGDIYLGTLLVGRPLADYLRLRFILISVYCAIGIINFFGSYIIGYLVAKRAFEPVVNLTRVVENIDLDRLDQTIRIKGNPRDEIVALAIRFNAMIERLKDMATRQKELIANVSHELKTPLTRMISTLDLASGSKVTFDPDSLRKELFAINALLDHMLLLAKHKRDLPAPSVRSIHIASLLNSIRNTLTKEIEEKNLTLSLLSPTSVSATIPVHFMEIVLRNILTNAVKYTPRGKSVSVKVSQVESTTHVHVSNEGEIYSQKQVSQMLGRFQQGEKKSVQFGYGIGLSLVAQICKLYNISFEASPRTHGGLLVTLSWKV